MIAWTLVTNRSDQPLVGWTKWSIMFVTNEYWLSLSTTIIIIRQKPSSLYFSSTFWGKWQELKMLLLTQSVAVAQQSGSGCWGRAGMGAEPAVEGKSGWMHRNQNVKIYWLIYKHAATCMWISQHLSSNGWVDKLVSTVRGLSNYHFQEALLVCSDGNLKELHGTMHNWQAYLAIHYWPLLSEYKWHNPWWNQCWLVPICSN